MPTDQEYLQAIAPDTGSLLDDAAARHGVDPHLAHSVMQVESAGNPNALSPKGAIGPMQLMPDTAKSLGVDPHDPAQNIEGGVKLLKQLTDHYGGDFSKAAAAYNAGQGAVDRAGGVPKIPETQQYVDKVGEQMEQRAKDPKNWPAMISPPNIPLRNRPEVVNPPDAENPHGSKSTVSTITIESDGKGILLPTIIDGKRVDNPTAIKHWQDTGESLGVFKTENDANEYDKRLHTMMGWNGAPGGGQAQWQASAKGGPSDQDYLNALGPEPDALHADHSNPANLPTAQHFDRSHQTFMDRARATFNRGVEAVKSGASALDKAVSPYIPAPLRALPAMSDEALPNGVIRPLQDALRPPTQYAEPEPTTPAGKIAQGVGSGIAHGAEQLTTPGNIGLIVGSDGIGLIPKIGAYLPRAISAYFGAKMFKDAIEKVPGIKDKIAKGDLKGAAEDITGAVVNGVLGTMAARHVVMGEGVPRGTSEAEPETKAANVETKGPIPETPATETKPAAGVSKGPTDEEFLSALYTGPPSTAEESAKAFEQHGKTYAELFEDLSDNKDKARAASATGAANKPGKPVIPEEGEPEGVARAQDARERLSQHLTGQPFADLHNSDRMAIDDLITQGFGKAVQPGEKAPGEGEVRGPAEVVPMPKPESAKPADNISTPRKAEAIQPGQEPEKPASGGPKGTDAQPLVTEVMKPGTAPEDFNRGATALKPELAPQGQPSFKVEDGHFVVREENGAPAMRVPLSNPDSVKGASFLLRHMGEDGMADELEKLGGVKAGPEPVKGKEAERAPTVEPAQGKAVNISIPGGPATYPAKYAVRELADVRPSHNPFSFGKNPEFEHANDRDYESAGNAARVVEQAQNFNPDFLTTDSPTAENGAPIIDKNGNVLGGNSRTMTLARVYEAGGEKADAYRKALADKAESLGIKPDELARFKNPVLVRELSGAHDAQKAITDFNKAGPARLNPEEQAYSDGKRMSAATVAELAGRMGESVEGGTLAEALRGEDGAEVINKLVKDGVLTQQETNGLIDDRGHLTPEIKTRIAKALVGRLFNSAKEISQAPHALRGKLERIAPQVLRVEGRKGWELTRLVREAIGIAEEMRVRKAKAEDLEGQVDVEGKQRSFTPAAKQIAEVLNEGAKNAEYAFRRYANDEMLSRPGAQTPMFEPPTREQAFRDAFGDGPLDVNADRVPKLSTRPLAIESGNSWVNGLTDYFHGKESRIAPIELTAKEREGTDAYVLNSNGMEWLARTAGQAHDRMPLGTSGLHISADQLKGLARNMERRIRSVYEGGPSSLNVPGTVEYLYNAVKNAADAGKDLIFINGHPAFSDYSEGTLEHELAHSTQSRTTSGTGHMGGQRDYFLSHPLAEKAAAMLSDRYSRSKPSQMAMEIGVRLMTAGHLKMVGPAWRELGLNEQEARDLGAQYLRSLRKEYGNAAPREIAKGVFEHAPARSERKIERRERLESLEPTRGGGAPERTGSNVSGDQGQPATAGDRTGATEPGNPRNGGERAPGTQVLERIPGENGTEAVIAKTSRGFNVAVRDTDAGQYLPESRTFDTLEKARKYAATIKAPEGQEPGAKTVPGSPTEEARANQIARGFEKAGGERRERGAETVKGEQPDLFSRGEDVAKANQRDADALTKQRLEAQLKAPISREEQLKKLKRDKTNRQDDLFAGPAEEKQQGSLFDASHVENKPALDLEAMRHAQMLRKDDPQMKLSDFSKEMGEEFGTSKGEAVSLFTKAGKFMSEESGSFNPQALREAYSGSRAAQRIADLKDVGKRMGTRVAEQGGGAGQKLMDMIERAEREGGVDAGQQFAKWADIRPSKLSDEQAFEVSDALEGRGKPTTERAQRAFEIARELTNENAGKATAYGAEVRTPNGKRPFMGIENYLPHTQNTNADALSKGPIRENVIQSLVREGIQPDKKAATKMLDDWVNYLNGKHPADSILKYLEKSGQATDAADALAKLQKFRKDNISVRRSGNLEFSRELNLPFYDRDVRRVIPAMIAQSARRLNQIKEFGQEHQKINQEVFNILQHGGDADYVRQAVDRMIGRIEQGKTAEARMASFAMALQTLKLPYVGLQHSMQGINTLLATDLPTFASGMAAAFGKAGKRFSIESGAGAEPAIRDAIRAAGADNRFVDRYLRATGLTTSMRFNRALAANAGAKWAKSNFAALQAGGKGADIARTRLTNLGIDPQEALDRGSLSDRDFLRAGKSMADFTMFRNKPQDLPDIFTGTPIGRVMTQFKHWGYQEMTMVSDQIKRDFKEGKGRGLRTLLVLGTVFPAAGAVVQIVKDAMNGKDREFEDGLDQYLYSLMHSSALGLAGEAVSSASTRHSLELIAGPTAGDVASLSDILLNKDMDASDKMAALRKYAVQRYAGPARRLFDDQ